jgi:LuxR family transcriptional regulator, maltose regulon positive regulatory protein
VTITSRRPSHDGGRKRRAGSQPGTLATDVEKGHQALARSEWQRSRAFFEKALRREETPEALEGLGMAAFWLDEATTVFASRERAYRLYRRRDDRRGAGRVAATLADDYFSFRGEAAVARGWFERARRLLEGLPLIPEQGWLKLAEGHFALMLGEEPERVRTLAVEAAAAGRGLGDIDVEMTALALEGLALVIQGELSQGMQRLDEATTAVVSGEMTDPVAIGRASCLLVLACERTRDFERAAQWCHRIKEFCERARFNFPLAICRTQYAGVLTWRGCWADAEGELQAAIKLAAARPGLHQEALIGLADLRRLQGRFEEAASLLREVEGHPLSILACAALALDRSEPAAAVRFAQRLLRRLPVSNRTDRVAALDVLLRAQVALGQRKEARGSLEKLKAIAEMVATEPMTANALFAEGLVAYADDDYDRARNAIEDAVVLYAQSGALLAVARCHVELGRVLAAVGERDTADAELREALLMFEKLGARGYIVTTTALRREVESGGRVAPAGRQSSAPLTPREVEVLRLVAQGMTNQRIAKRLVVSEFTIKRHVANLLTKLSLPSRAAAAAYAARQGLA